MSLLSCKNVELRYGSQTVASNISFEVEAGSYLCIVGQNGSGKTTLMKAILGLMPVSSGEISFEDGFSRREIGYLPQQTAAQRDFPASVNEVVLSGCINNMGLLPFYGAAQKKKAAAALKRLGIENLGRQSFKNLSGGQQQRVLLARALCATKSLLLLDEPTAALDPRATAEFYSLLRSLSTEDNITVIMISHDMTEAVANSDYILHLDKTMLFFGLTSDYLKTDAGRAFIGDTDNE